MPDALAVYGAVAGSAGLLSLGWQLIVRHQDGKTRLVIEASHHGRTVFPDDPRYDYAQPILTPDHEERETKRGQAPTRLLFGTVVTATNLSKHSVWVRGGGIDQPATGGICAMFAGPTEVKPLTTFYEFWIEDWWAVGEQGMDLREYPIRAFIDLDDGSARYSGETYLYPRPARRRPKAGVP